MHIKGPDGEINGLPCMARVLAARMLAKNGHTNQFKIKTTPAEGFENSVSPSMGLHLR